MSNVTKVAEIFINAGDAFSRLGELTMDLQKDDTKSCGAGKWTDDEIELLKQSVTRFGQDIEKISQMVRTRTAKQIKEAIKRRNLLESNDKKAADVDGSTFHVNNRNSTLANDLEKQNNNRIVKSLESNISSINSDHEIDVVNDSTVSNSNETMHHLIKKKDNL